MFWSWLLITLQNPFLQPFTFNYMPVLGVFLAIALLALKLIKGEAVPVKREVVLVSALYLVVVLTSLGTKNPLLIVSTLLLPLVLVYFSHDYEKFKRVIEITLWVHVLFFFTQVIGFILFQTYIDPMAYISSEHSSVFSQKGLKLFDTIIPRFSGLYSEPGNYATWVFLQFIMIARYRENKLLTSLVFISVLLSFSAFGYIYLLLYFLYLLVVKKRVSIIFWSSPLIAYLLYLINVRVGLGYGIYDRLEQVSSMFNIDFLLFGLSNTHYEVLMVEDLGLWYALFAYGGIFLFAVFALFFLYRMPLLSFVVFTSKVKVFYPFLYLYIIFLIYSKYAKSKKISKCKSL